MALQNTDNFLVSRAGSSHKLAWSDLQTDISASLDINDAFVTTGDPVTGVQSIVPYSAAYGIQLPVAGVNDYNISGALRYNSVASKIELYDGSGWVTASGNTAFSSAPPATASEGDIWYDVDDGRSYVYYNDGDSSQWVEMNPSWNGGIPPESITPDKISEGGIQWTTSGDHNITGSLGIGTTTPVDSLEVVGGVTISDATDAVLSLNSAVTGSPFVIKQTDTNNVIISNAALPMVIGPNGNQRLTLQTNSTPRLTILSGGNLGIGTETPQAKLHVDGDTHVEGNLTVSGLNVATAVKVQSGGFGTSSNRPIACFGNAANPTLSSNSEIKFAIENAPTIKGDGTIKAVKVQFGSSDAFQVNSIGKLTSPFTYNNTSSNSSNFVRLNSNGDFQRNTSSRRYKDNIRNLDEVVGGLDVILSLEPRQWEDHGSGETVTGLIAEEVHAAGAHLGVVWEEWNTKVPHNGTTPVTKDGSVAKEGDLVVDGVSDRGLILHLVEAVKELKAENDALKARLDEAGAR